MIFCLLSNLLNEFNLLSKKNDLELKNNINFDSIVVLTGKFDRIKKGFELLEANYSKKMFISGVNPIVKKNELRKIIIPNNEIINSKEALIFGFLANIISRKYNNTLSSGLANGIALAWTFSTALPLYVN